jgi:hypothetical protein
MCNCNSLATCNYCAEIYCEDCKETRSLICITCNGERCTECLPHGTPVGYKSCYCGYECEDCWKKYPDKVVCEFCRGVRELFEN